MNPTVYTQLPGDAGVFQTVHMMRELINKNFLHPWIREKAAQIVAICNREPACEHRALLGYVNRIIQYVRDPSGVEALHDPVTFYEQRLRSGQSVFGDCDDMTVYLATLLKSIGHAPRFRILSRFENGSFHHVLVFCHNQNLDPSMAIGNQPRNPKRAVQIPI